MVRILYEIDEGPVDMLWQVHEGSRLWFDTVVAVDEAENQRRKVGAFGGVEAADQCFYAFSGHNARGDNRFHYALRIRDLLPVVDWSAGQRYRFCVEKVAAGCAAPPCRVAENGECDAP